MVPARFINLSLASAWSGQKAITCWRVCLGPPQGHSGSMSGTPILANQSFSVMDRYRELGVSADLRRTSVLSAPWHTPSLFSRACGPSVLHAVSHLIEAIYHSIRSSVRPCTCLYTILRQPLPGYETRSGTWAAFQQSAAAAATASPSRLESAEPHPQPSPRRCPRKVSLSPYWLDAHLSTQRRANSKT